MRLVLPIILITISVVGFITLISPMLDEIKILRADVASYNAALDNATQLKDARDRLTKQYNSFDPEDLKRLETLLPNSVNNIRLILEIEDVASPYGMVLRDVKYDTVREQTLEAESQVVQAGTSQALAIAKDYGVWSLEFSTEGSYTNFLNFLRNLESNLRLIDIASIEFTSTTAGGSQSAGVGISPLSSNKYEYGFKIKTYWLKNVFEEK